MLVILEYPLYLISVDSACSIYLIDSYLSALVNSLTVKGSSAGKRTCTSYNEYSAFCIR